MIRIILRRLIIPQGDTGSFTLPLLQTAERGDTAVLAIYDPLYKTTVLRLVGEMDANRQVIFNFAHKDTIDIEPSNRYLWDVKIYHNPTSYDDQNIPLGAEQIDSYYSAFSLPKCEVREAP